MRAPLSPPNEPARLIELQDYRILDTPVESAFDALTKVAAQILDVPIALISIVDAERQWFKSRYGLDVAQTPRDISFCGHVVEQDAQLVVPDAQRDGRFADNPLVTGDPHVRFYAGTPLRTGAGFVLGTLCAIDHVARDIGPEKLEALELLAGQVVQLLELRRTGLRLVEARDAERRAEERLHKIIDNVPALVGYWDQDLRNVFANRAYSEWFGQRPDEIQGGHIRDLLGPDLYEKNRPLLERALAGEQQHFQRTILTPSGPRHSAATYAPDRVGDQVRGIFVLVTDITELEVARAKQKEQSEAIERLARTDMLTGLLNRRAAADLIERERARAARSGERLFVVMLDVDHFKRVNDEGGHLHGDEVLKHVGDALLATTRQADICARWGGEEFLVLLTATSPEGALQSAERIRVSAGRAGDTPPVTLSAGLAEWQFTDQSFDQALGAADGRLYQAKQTGRNRLVR
jgi:diguanylate cyclase (GGDEF)-like protein/PAS domain S-box-containing protein